MLWALFILTTVDQLGKLHNVFKKFALDPECKCRLQERGKLHVVYVYWISAVKRITCTNI